MSHFNIYIVYMNLNYWLFYNHLSTGRKHRKIIPFRFTPGINGENIFCFAQWKKDNNQPFVSVSQCEKIFISVNQFKFLHQIGISWEKKDGKSSRTYQWIKLPIKEKKSFIHVEFSLEDYKYVNIRLYTYIRYESWV